MDVNEAIASAIPAEETSAPEPEQPVDTGIEVPEQEPEATEQTEPDAQPEPVAAKPKPSIDNDEAFTDEALATPDAIRTARELIQEQRRASHRKYLELAKREERFKKDKGEVLQLRDNLRAQSGLLQNDLQALRNGDASTALQALSRLTGRPGPELLEEININLARNGKRPEPSRETIELKNELAQLKQFIQQQQESQKQQQLQAHIAQEKRHIVQLANNAERFPLLATYVEDNPEGVADDVAEYITQQYQQGVRLDYETALSNIEAGLRAKVARLVPKVAPQGEPGRETGAAAKPVAPQVGRTLAPSLATQSAGVTREVTEGELNKRFIQEFPEFFDQFG